MLWTPLPPLAGGWYAPTGWELELLYPNAPKAFQVAPATCDLLPPRSEHGRLALALANN